MKYFKIVLNIPHPKKKNAVRYETGKSQTKDSTLTIMSIKKDYLHTVEYHPACLEDSDQFFPLCCMQGQPHGLAYDVSLLLAKLPVGHAAHEQVWKEHEEI